MKMIDIGKQARKSARILALMSEEEKNRALKLMADGLIANSETIQKENAKDLEQAKKDNLTDAMVDRLTLDAKRVQAMADGITEIIALADPVGRVYDEKIRPNGLKVHRVRIPIGVIGIIYESRPNVTADAAALCIKSGNAVVLRGGKEAFYSNKIIVSILSKALEDGGIDKDVIQFVDTTDRSAVLEMLKMNEYIDVIIPRGGSGLIKFVSENSTIPVVKHDAGVCSVYIDETADVDMATDIAVNSKAQRPGVCNAAENIFVHKNWAGNLPELVGKFTDSGVEVRGCKRTQDADSRVKPATDDDWFEEYLELIVSVRVVDSMEEAMDLIELYGSHHTDVIVTNSDEQADLFLKAVDSSAVIVNASTRFNDGGQFGLGAEMGISTQKLHCRGPMGLEELTTYKFVALGTGQTRS